MDLQREAEEEGEEEEEEAAIMFLEVGRGLLEEVRGGSRQAMDPEVE